MDAKPKDMEKIRYRSDRTIFSTHNNGFAGNERDETLVAENLVDTQIPIDDRIPDGVGEIVEDERPVYDEEGYQNEPGE